MNAQTEAVALEDAKDLAFAPDSPDFQLAYGAADILKDEADYKAGRIEAVSWEEAKAKADAVRR